MQNNVCHNICPSFRHATGTIPERHSISASGREFLSVVVRVNKPFPIHAGCHSKLKPASVLIGVSNADDFIALEKLCTIVHITSHAALNSFIENKTTPAD